MMGGLKNILIFFLLYLSTLRVYSAVYYVSYSKGNDSYTTAQAQSSNTPWKTIQKAENTVLPGDRVYILSGTQLENVSFDVDGTSDNYIYFIGKSDGTTYVNGTGYILYFSGANYIKIRNLNVYGGQGIRVQGNSTHIDFSNCSSYSNGGYQGLYVYDANDISFRYGSIFDNNNQQIYIRGTSSNVLIYNNEIHNSIYNFDKIFLADTVKLVKIVKNQIWGGGLQSGVKLNWQIKNAQIVSNTIFSNQYGVYVNYSSTNKFLYNNIYDNMDYGVYIRGSTSLYNIISGNNIYNQYNITNQNIGLFIEGYYTFAKSNYIHKNYERGIDIKGARHSVIDNNYISTNAKKSQIIGASLSGWYAGLMVDVNASSNVIKNNFCFSNNHHGMFLTSTTRNEIYNNKVYKNYHRGIYLYTVKNCNFYKNSIYSNRENGMEIVITSYSNSIYSNNFRKNFNRGLVIQGSTTASYNVYNNNIYGNTFYRNAWQGIAFDVNTYGNIINNNIVIGNASGTSSWDAGILLATSVHDTKIINNICISNRRYGISIYTTGTKPYNNIISNNIIYKSSYSGIRVENADNTYIYNNTSYSNYRDAMVFNTASGIKCIGNSMYGNIEHGMSFYSANNNYFYSNIIADNGFGVLLYNTSSVTLCRIAIYGSTNYGIYLYNSDNNILHHLSIVSNGINSGDGIYIDGGSQNNELINSIVSGTRNGYGIVLISGGSIVTKYCDVYGNVSGDYSGLSAGSGSISSDPDFVSFDYLGGNFLSLSLENYSPCLDSGTNIGYSYLGFAPDMGWDEFGKAVILHISKSITNISMNGISTVPIPGATVKYCITYKVITNWCKASNVLIYDKIPIDVVYITNSNIVTGWSVEYSTDISPSQSYNSLDYTTVLPQKDKIRWIRWKRDYIGNEYNRLFYSVVIK